MNNSVQQKYVTNVSLLLFCDIFIAMFFQEYIPQPHIEINGKIQVFYLFAQGTDNNRLVCPGSRNNLSRIADITIYADRSLCVRV